MQSKETSLRVIVACGPFHDPQNSDTKKLLRDLLQKVSLSYPDFFIIIGPLLLER